ncbi:MAG: hypothetical protein IJZ55_08090 [Lachnospiraceae bacterium]|nr:hypothetical protein [Lachnospiraceae bacterium]
MYLIENGKLFKVQTDVFETRKEALAVSEKLKAAGLANYVLKTERWVIPGEKDTPDIPITMPEVPGTETPALPEESEKKTLSALAREVIEGKWGNGKERKERLTEAGYDYGKVQSKVNEMLR